MKYLKAFKDEEKKKLKSIGEEEKFAFKVIDIIVDALAKEFKGIPREAILDVLEANSLDMVKTYKCLNDDDQARKCSFTAFEDNIILNKKDNSKQYSKILKEKGEKIINERLAFLNN